VKLTPWKGPDWHTVLKVDAMYFHAARQAHAKGIASLRAIERAESRAGKVQERIDALNEMLAQGRINDSDHYDKLEPLAIRMDDLEYDVGAAYGLLLENVGTVHILAAAALEAHINIRAENSFSCNRVLEAFERLSLDAKWLMFPRFHGLQGFDTGSEPFQGFDRLVKFRNRLVHYKTRREPWRGASVPPEFLGDLGLTSDAATQSLAAVRGMTAQLAVQLGESPPWWVEGEATNFFEIETERSRRKAG
jgi:uncharacterized coiled-coil protein SlyX